ncbi:MAG: ABC transporter permease [Caldimicrobium sp.]|jgi:Nod factor-specific ABC transporter NodJ protein
MKGFLAVYLRELLLLRKRLFKLVLSFSVNPILYILAFGIGLGKHLSIMGRPYLEFLIPGLISASSMLQAFAINVEINVARFYLKVFEEFQSAPLSSISYALGEILAGVTRAFLSVFIIIIFAYFFGGVNLHFNGMFFFIVFLNAFIFASLGLASAMTIKAHGDQTLITNFIITPMMFLGGTFFPVENLPPLIKPIIEILPLTLVSKTLRAISWGQFFSYRDLFILSLIAIFCFIVSILTIKRAKED